MTDPRSRRSQRIFLAIIALMFVVAGSFVIEGALESGNRYLTGKRADTTTTGTWVDVENRCGRYIAYEVDGREYRLDTASGRHVCSSASEGEPAEVSYDASAPADAHRGAAGTTAHLLLTLAWVLTGIVLIALTPRAVRALRADLRRQRDLDV